MLAVGAIIVTVVLVARCCGARPTGVLVVALTLVLGGALGNLVDRFFRSPGFLRGHVVDFVAVGWWPVFNVADSCVTIGAILLIVRSLRPPAADPAEIARRRTVSEPIPVPAALGRRAGRPRRRAASPAGAAPTCRCCSARDAIVDRRPRGRARATSSSRAR